MKVFVASSEAEQPHHMLLQVRLDYILDILPQTKCPAIFSFWLQSCQSRLVSFFFFSNITAKLFI